MCSSRQFDFVHPLPYPAAEHQRKFHRHSSGAQNGINAMAAGGTDRRLQRRRPSKEFLMGLRQCPHPAGVTVSDMSLRHAGLRASGDEDGVLCLTAQHGGESQLSLQHEVR